MKLQVHEEGSVRPFRQRHAVSLAPHRGDALRQDARELHRSKTRGELKQRLGLAAPELVHGDVELVAGADRLGVRHGRSEDAQPYRVERTLNYKRSWKCVRLE